MAGLGPLGARSLTLLPAILFLLWKSRLGEVVGLLGPDSQPKSDGEGSVVMGEESHFGVGQTLGSRFTWVPLSLQQTFIKHRLYTVLGSEDTTVCGKMWSMPCFGYVLLHDRPP